MAKKTSAKPKRKRPSVKVKRRSSGRRSSGPVSSLSFTRFVLPLLIILMLIGAVAFMALSGYQTATASGFFGLRSVDIRGNERTASDDIQRIVETSVEKTGVWNADLGDIRAKLEKFPFVRSAAVSRVLPSAIRVNVTERVPAAIVHLSSGNFLLDDEGTLLVMATAKNNDFPFILQGWDESKTEKALTDNAGRLKLYKKMLDECKQFDLASRVRDVDLTNPRAPIAVVLDSGRAIGVTLARDKLGASLKLGIEALSGKGEKVKSVDAGGVFPVINYLDF